MIVGNDEIPSPANLRKCRETLGLSQTELAEQLGFKEEGWRVIIAWEAGERYGKPFSPTPLAWTALRYMLMAVILYKAIPAGARRDSVAELLPEVLR